ncbi:MAG TPA: SGNH/GDSL hydrolase family protein [Ignavibacteriaceae bacterium]|nr:SGNH/GDSL hydrolase family protein [Ignavibacteriaceae bacterium]
MKYLIILFLLIMTIEEDIFAQDWANLNKYKAANDTLVHQKKNIKRIVFMGDSITEFWTPDFFTKTNYINRGISGQTTPQMLVRFRPDVVNLKPDVVVILAGTNDIAGNTGSMTLEMIEDNLKSMCEIAKANKIKVVLCSVLPVYDYTWKKGMEPAEKIYTLNKWIKNYADKNNYAYVDYYSPTVDDNKGIKKEYSEDGVHPNKKGYDVMEPIVKEAITKILSK